VISLVVPLMNFSWLHISTAQNMPLTDLVNSINAPVAGQPVKLFIPGSALFGISVFISTLLLIFLTLKINWIYSIKKKNRNIKMWGFTWIETDIRQAPFSFLSNLFWKKGLSVTDINGEKIFRHELTHIVQKHTYDKLFSQIVFCLFWMNPFYWLIQKELNTIHEFMADAASVADGDTASFAEMLLHTHNEGSYRSPAHAFFNSSIKRRLIMISSLNKTRHSWLRRLLALPVALFVLTVLSVSMKTPADTKTNFQTGKAVRQAAADTIPGPVSAPAKQSLEPITVAGRKSTQQNGDQINVVTVTGRPSAKKQSLEPITVAGKESTRQNGDQITVVTVTGRPSAKKQSLEPITVAGKKTDGQQDGDRARVIIVTGRPSDKKQTPDK
jgi:hypothetical protein